MCEIGDFPLRWRSRRSLAVRIRLFFTARGFVSQTCFPAYSARVSPPSRRMPANWLAIRRRTFFSIGHDLCGS